MRNETGKRKAKHEKEREEILKELEKISELIKQNEILFNLADDENMVEALIYEQKSLNARYIHLLKKAKENGLRIDYIDRLTQ